MAEGGDYFGHDNPTFDQDIDNENQEVNRTQPFQPGAASTPYHVGEQIQIQTTMHEESGQPDISYEETPLLGDFFSSEEKRNHIDKAFEYIKNRFPRVDLKKLGPIGFGKKPSTQGNIVSYGPKGGETPIFKKDGSGFQKSFTEKFKKTLGPTAEQIIAEKNAEIQDKNQELVAVENHQQQLDQEIEKQMLQMKKNKDKSIYTQKRIETVKNQHGDNASDSELRRLEREKRNYSYEAEKNEKNIEDLEKKAKENKEKFSRKKARVDEIVKEKKSNRRATLQN